MTPLADDPAPLDPQSESTYPAELAPLLTPVRPSATLVLPSIEPRAVNVAGLQEELKQLAVQLVSDYPYEAASHHFAAQIYFELKQSELAEQFWNKCIGMSPKQMGPYVGLATLLMEKGRHEEAIEVLLQAEGLGGNSPELMLKLGEAYENLGNIEKAAERLQQGVQTYPEHAELWQVFGRVQNQKGNAAEAETSLRRSIELGGENEPLLFALNAALMRQGKTQESATVRESIAKLKRPKQFEQDKFQDRYDNALTRIGADVMISAATLAETNGDLDLASRLYLRACELDPKNIGSYQGLLTVARRHENLADQRLILRKLIEVDSKNVVNYTNLASVAMQAGDAPLAEATLKAAVDLDPGGILAQAASAKLYLSLRNFTMARLMAAQVVERQPSAAAYRLLAATYHAEGLEDAFEAANKRAVELEQASRNSTLK